MRFLDINPKNRNAFASCGANPLGIQLKIKWLNQCINHRIHFNVPIRNFLIFEQKEDFRASFALLMKTKIIPI